MFQYIKWFRELGIGDVDLVGGKNASLGEMYQNLSKEGIRIPNGFAITADAYRHILDGNDAWKKLHEQLDVFDPDEPGSNVIFLVRVDFKKPNFIAPITIILFIISL